MSIYAFQLIINVLFSFLLLSKQRKLNSIPEYLSSNIAEDIRNLMFLLPENKIISFNDSLINVTLYNTSDNFFTYDKMNIEFKNCLTILQDVYDLDPFFNYTNNDNNEIYKRCFFIIIKIEIDRQLINKDQLFIDYDNVIQNNNNKENNTTKCPTNHIEYLIFNGKDGSLLNTTYCKDLNVTIFHPIVNPNGIDLNTSKLLYEEFKIDVYRTNDSFFNDFCMNYTSDKKTDLTLSQRRKMFYQNVSFCDSNCTYIKINYTRNTAICVCEIGDGVMNDVLLRGGEFHEHNSSFTYEQVFSLVNYKIFICYKEVFNLKRLIINVGNYATITIIILYIICLIHFCINKKRNVMHFFQIIKIKMNEKKKEINAKDEKNKIDNINNKKDKKDNSFISEQNNSEKFNKTKSIKINDIIITDISNPPQKNKKIKIASNNNNGNNIHKIREIEYIMKSNDNITKESNALVHNYGDIKIDTNDELINKKDEKNWDDIIRIKRKDTKKKHNQKKHIHITFGQSSTLGLSTKNNSIKSNKRKLDYSSNKTINQTNNYLDNYNNLINLLPSFNYSVEIPISNILPSFLKPKTNLINNINTRYINSSNIKDSTFGQNSHNIFIIKRSKTKCNNAFYNNYLNKHDIISEKENDNNNESNNNDINCIDINNINNINKFNKNICTLRRTKDIIQKKKVKEKRIIKDNNYIKNNLLEFDDMKFEIAILIDNRNFCEKFICELKENCIIIVLCFRNDIMFKQIRLSLFILSCTLDFFFNAFFYSDTYLEQRYEEDTLITILIDYPKEIFSSLASQFIVKLIELLMEDKALSCFLKRIASQNKNYLKGVNYLLKKYEQRFYIYISIGFIILGFTWYYVCAFCTVYQNTQMKLLYDTVESCAINILLPFPISFLSVSFRHLAIKKLNKFLFFLSNMVRIFA
jgi:hypothetical protein